METMQQPIIKPSQDGLYTRCVWCRTEIPLGGVIYYSREGGVPSCCNRALPKEYIKLGKNGS